MAYQNVLVAFDASDGSKKALNHAMDYKKNNGGKLTVVHVIQATRTFLDDPPRPFVGGGVGADAADPTQFPVNGFNSMPNESTNMEAEEKAKLSNSMEPEALQEGERMLGGAKRMLSQEYVKADTEVLEGDAAKSICDYATTNHIDLIVIGHRGLSGLKKLVLGSVSQKVTEHSDCAVLIVK